MYKFKENDGTKLRVYIVITPHWIIVRTNNNITTDSK